MRWTGWKCNGSSQQGETEWESMHGNHNCCNQWSVDRILDSALLVATIKTLDYSQMDDYLFGPHLQKHQHLWKMMNDLW